MSSEPDDDPVEVRIPVQLRRSRDDAPISLFQYPLRPSWRAYDTASLQSARARPVSQKIMKGQNYQVELQLPPETGSSALEDADASDKPMRHITLASTLTPPKTSYAIGMLVSEEDGEQYLRLAPLSSCLQLRPSFTQVDEAEAELNKASGKGADAASSSQHADASAFGPIFRPAQSEKEIEARRNSHAYMAEQQDLEAWSPATLHPPESSESSAVRDAVFGIG